MNWKKSLFVVMLVGMTVFALVGCGQTKSETATVPSATQTPSNQPQDSMAQVAAILGISQQKLEDAFAQARSELGNKGLPTTPGGTGQPIPPSDNQTPAPSGKEGSPSLPKDLLAKVAEILGTDQQTLENAFAKVQGSK